MSDVTAEQVAEELSLTEQQILTLRTLQARLLQNDVEHETKSKRCASKQRALDRFVTDAFAEVAALDGSADWLPSELADLDEQVGNAKVELFVSTASALAGQVSERSAGVVILAELLVFNPWEDGSRWDKDARTAGLELTAQELEGLKSEDLDKLTEELDGLLKALRRKSIKWGRVAVLTVLGAGLGVATGGLAAPAIGGMIGGSMGLTGAAATSAGLATLGGGSIAAGGFGVAGGTMLVSGIGGVAAAGMAAAGARFSPIGSQSIAAEAVKLDLVARVLLADSPNRDEKMRRVVESLQESINTLSDQTKLLVDKIDRLKKEKAATDAENRSLKDEIKSMKAELDAARAAETVLTVVRDRLPEAVA